MLRDVKPDIVLVVGDVNSTLACALVAAKCGVPVAHVEAGLRSFDRSMPEEINRVLTDHVSDWLFVSEPAGEANLLREGIPPSRIHFVGNVMIDTLLSCRDRARRLRVAEGLGLATTPVRGADPAPAPERRSTRRPSKGSCGRSSTWRGTSRSCFPCIHAPSR